MPFCLCVCVRARVCVFVCVCERERERARLARVSVTLSVHFPGPYFFPRFQSKNAKRNKVVDPSSSLQPTDSPL